MKKRAWLSTILAFLCSASFLFGCTPTQPNESTPDNSESIVAPDSTPSDDSTDSDDNNDSTGGGNSDNSTGSDDSTGGDNTEDDYIDLPDDYVITMSDMERFLLTKDEQYPITNEYVEVYQQESGG